MSTGDEEPVIDEEKMIQLEEKLRIQCAKHGFESSCEEISAAERIVGCAATAKAFLSWVDNTRIRADWINKQIVVREAGGNAARGSAQSIIGQLVNQLAGLDCLTGTYLASRINGDMRISDAGVVVKGRSTLAGATSDGFYPVIITEVCSSQELRDLHENALWYFNHCPSIEYYLSFKRYGARTVGGDQAMLAAVYSRAGGGNPNQIISFGTGPVTDDVNVFYTDIQCKIQTQGVGAGGPACDRLGAYVIQLPTAQIFRTRVGGVPGGVLLNLTLDLYPIHLGFLNESIPM